MKCYVTSLLICTYNWIIDTFIKLFFAIFYLLKSGFPWKLKIFNKIYSIIAISDPNLRSPNTMYCTSAEGGGFRFLGSCYHLVTTRKSWEEAEQHCVDTFGGHLVTILDRTKDVYLKYLLQSMITDIWIGIKIRVIIVFRILNGMIDVVWFNYQKVVRKY